MAVGEVAGGRQRPGLREQKLGAVLRRRPLWQQPQRSAEPARSAFGCEPGCCLASFTQDGDGGSIPLARRPLDVVGAPSRCHSPHSERLRAPLVRIKPPAASSGVIDSAPDERVSEAEASGHLRGANQIELQEFVKGRHCCSLGCGGRSSRQLGLEWIARDRCSFEHEAPAVRHQREFFAERSGDRFRDLEVCQ
jgi:hypothetical protein